MSTYPTPTREINITPMMRQTDSKKALIDHLNLLQNVFSFIAIIVFICLVALIGLMINAPAPAV